MRALFFCKNSIINKIMDRLRYLGKSYKDYIKSATLKIKRIDDNDLHGYAAYRKITEVNYPFIVGEKGKEICLCDNGYSILNYLPDNGNWHLHTAKDNHGKTVEWYIDITRINSIDEKGMPYFYDLYLDIVIRPDGSLTILDEDELQDALNDGNISKDEYNLARETMNKLIREKTVSVSYLEALCSKITLLFG